MTNLQFMNEFSNTFISSFDLLKIFCLLSFLIFIYLAMKLIVKEDSIEEFSFQITNFCRLLIKRKPKKKDDP